MSAIEHPEIKQSEIRQDDTVLQVFDHRRAGEVRIQYVAPTDGLPYTYQAGSRFYLVKRAPVMVEIDADELERLRELETTGTLVPKSMLDDVLALHSPQLGKRMTPIDYLLRHVYGDR